MCGRFALFTDPPDLADEFDLAEPSFEPTYNAAPSEDLPVVLDDAPETISTARWGLVPSWADGPGSGPDPINARAESLADTRIFRDAYRERRCVVPVDGFYEWSDSESGNHPYYVSRTDDRPFLLAGLWETWMSEQTQTGLGEFVSDGPSRDPETVRSFTIVTTDPNDTVAAYHDRMPVVLDAESGDRWLYGSSVDEVIGDSQPSLAVRRVSTAVNDPTNDRPELVEAVG
jgi:putative SOS response-associated peptidase YedK